MRSTQFAALGTALMLLGAPIGASAAEGTRIQVTGEIIDTWCYYSGVMGSPDAVVGSAHHTCALWCSAGVFLWVCWPKMAPSTWSSRSGMMPKPQAATRC
ncbi:hypothetical protein ACERZ8_00635 [Tateyamaria armeniaca]|uniref:Uncharacterized protein n=1 Tax=Tateyamaria armeniaca TaxID=2518930 RepID=A0ABW8UMU7_9RHOB